MILLIPSKDLFLANNDISIQIKAMELKTCLLRSLFHFEQELINPPVNFENVKFEFCFLNFSLSRLSNIGQACFI